jgi:glycosyltransferase involved in cell wall biosynthesis
MSKGIHQSVGIPFARLDGVDIRLPRVNVIIGNYNQGRFARDAIRSVAQQTYADFDCVVIDDFSTDDSVKQIQAALDELNDGRFRFIPRKENGGQMASMFTGFDEGDAPFVAFLDADDVWLPSFLETHIACHLNPEINAAMSSSNMAIIDGSGILVAGANPSLSQCSPARNHHWLAPIDRLPSLRQTAERPQAEPNIFFVKNNFQEWIWSPTSGLVFRRTVLGAIRPENIQDFPSCADTYLARFSHFVGGSILVHDVHGYYRMHGKNIYSKNTVVGDNIIFGKIPESVASACASTILRKLCEDPFFARTLKPVNIATAVLKLARTPSEIAMVMSAKLIRSTLPTKLRRKLSRRIAKKSIHNLFSKFFHGVK